MHPLSGYTLQAILVFEGQAVAGATQIWWPVLLPRDMVKSGSGLQLRAISRSMSLMQPGPELMFVTAVNIKG